MQHFELLNAYLLYRNSLRNIITFKMLSFFSVYAHFSYSNNFSPLQWLVLSVMQPVCVCKVSLLQGLQQASVWLLHCVCPCL